MYTIKELCIAVTWGVKYLNSVRASTMRLYAKLLWLASADLRLIFIALKTIITQLILKLISHNTGGKTEP